jgi:hypothetical protein
MSGAMTPPPVYINGLHTDSFTFKFIKSRVRLVLRNVAGLL